MSEQVNQVEQKEQKEMTQTEWVFAGMRLDEKGKKYFYWADANDINNNHGFDKNIAPAKCGWCLSGTYNK